MPLAHRMREQLKARVLLGMLVAFLMCCHGSYATGTKRCMGIARMKKPDTCGGTCVSLSSEPCP